MNKFNTTDFSPQFRRALLAKVYESDFLEFAKASFESIHGNALEDNWHHSAIANALALVRDGKEKRLLITLPPRSLKSFLVSVAFPAWVHALDPKLKILCTSYSDELAVSFANEWRQIIEAPWYKVSYPKSAISKRKNREGFTKLVGGGSRLSLGAGGSITGQGADIAIIDDPLNAIDAFSNLKRERINDWFSQTLVSRLNDKRTGAIIVVMQRLHPYDLAGKLIEAGGWHHVNLPAIAPKTIEVPLLNKKKHLWLEGDPLDQKREPERVLNNLRLSMGEQKFSAQYLQNPLPSDGQLILKKWFQFQDGETVPKNALRVLSIDTASSTSPTADYSVIQCWAIYNGKLILIDSNRGRWEYPDLKSNAQDMYAKHKAKYALVEAAGVGLALIKDLKRIRINSIEVLARHSKEQRLMQALPVLESQRVYLSSNAKWLDAFEAEILGFPSAKHDDQVDAMTQLINWNESRPRRRRWNPPSAQI